MSPPALRRHALKALATALAVGTLSACKGGGGPFGIFKGNKDRKKLPGTRISVLALERELRPDLQSADTPIILPKPEDIESWPQAGGLSHHAMYHMVIGPNPKLAWRANVGFASGKRNRNLAAPIVADGKVYTIDGKAEVACFNASNRQADLEDQDRAQARGRRRVPGRRPCVRGWPHLCHGRIR